MTDFNDPGTGGDRIEWKELLGSLLLFDVKRVEEGLATAFGETDVVVTDVAVLDGPSKATTYRDVFVFPKVLKAALRGSVGAKVLGRLDQGTAKVGQSAPWTLLASSDADKATARRYLAYIEAQAITVPEHDESPF